MSDAGQELIVLENVTFRRGRRVIFDNISLKIMAGSTVAVMGPSGTGKTTLLRLIGGQLSPDSGHIYVFGKDIAGLTRAELFEVRRDIGMLFQSGALFSDINVFENVAFPIRIHTNLDEQMIRDLVLMKLHAVGLRGANSLHPSELSGGMQRRVALARAMALDPLLMMYDEPFAGLDPIAKGVIVDLIESVADAYHTTSILVSHDIAESASIADYIYLISDGHLIGQGSPGDIDMDDSPRVRQFMDGKPDGPVPFHYPAPDYRDQLLSEDRPLGWFRFD